MRLHISSVGYAQCIPPSLLPSHSVPAPSLLPCTPLYRRQFYQDAIRVGVIVNPVEMLVIYVTEALGFLYSLMLRIFMIVVILMPFFGLIRHARREPGVGEVSHGF